MACDEALGEAVRSGKSLPVVRFFAWTPPTISFGYSQHVAREVDVDAARREGIGLVRRITGGRAVLHAEEITYSVICSERDPVAEGGIIATYTRISEGLANGLRRLGVSAELARSAEALSGPHLDRATLPCFGSTSRSEIVVGGRKIVGSAQHRMRRLVLQHGSILLGPAHQDLVRYLRVDEALRHRYLQRMALSTTSLTQLGWVGSRDEVIAALARGLSEVLGLTWINTPCGDGGGVGSPFYEDEEREINRLAREKYGTDSWNLRTGCAREVRDGSSAR